MAGDSERSVKRRYSYADYLNWPNDERFELIDGIIYNMNAPLRIHQKISMELCRQLATFFLGKTCEVYAAPFDVRLPKLSPKDDDIYDVIQPDISVICDPKKLDEKGCLGAPDLVVEVLSSSTSSHDHIRKRALYERTGVKEYWLVDPNNRTVMVYKLVNGIYQKLEGYYDHETVTSGLFPELSLDLKTVFPPHPAGYVVREYTGIRTEVIKKEPATRKKPASKNKPASKKKQ
ncbi:MAG: hypothetical protein A2W80_16130 [Candidatus Riflebacteria bacterium GWC2_50_8]|nr:MAG: hypothetical protein A2W80_16130 [Candidatus Riflebacteria bacterium GWC2_50_8]